ncbi:MAG: SDR family oxidoreductase [Kiritimatiellae bacterium]|nr:SDR family oxidoreductase [Kiritimatiellia bacterium]
MITYDLSGKTALVTGSNRGIGKAMADALEAAGAKVIRTCSKECDLSDRDAVYAFIEKTKRENQIDILVNNAGTILRKPAAEHPDEYWDKVIGVNLNSQFVLAREFGKDMVARGWGRIVFTCSLLTFQGGINVPGYAASKGGVGQLVKAFANEWASKGVNVNGIAPGYIATDNTSALRADPVRSRQILERIPAGRWGEASDIAGACVFLCSPAANYINGAIIPVDGGWLAR